MKTLLRLLGRIHEKVGRRWRLGLAMVYQSRFAKHGQRFTFDPLGRYTFETIYLGDDVSLGEGACLIASRSKIVIGNRVMFGPDVTIRGGNHRIDLVGRFMKDVKDEDKRPCDDLGVIIKDDVWVGTRAIILQGVTVGRGAVIAAGAVVTKDVPPYAIVGGNPARVIRFRWNVETILAHEKILYSEFDRLTAADIQSQQSGVTV